MSRRKRNKQNRSSPDRGGGAATATPDRESSIRVLRDSVEENELRIKDFQQKALIGAMATVATAKISQKIGRSMRALESAADLASNLVDPRDYLGDEYGVPIVGYYPDSIPSAIWHTEEGRRYPVFINEWELRAIRGMGYTMGTFHPQGVGIMGNLVNYTIGKGLRPTITPDKRFAENAEIKQAAVTAQAVVDEFVEHNRVYGDADREAFVRRRREGDGGISLWNEGGHVSLRFVEPDQITQPGAAEQILNSMDYDGEPSNFLFGIHSDNGDTNTVHGYYVQWSSSGQDWDYMPGGNAAFHTYNPNCATGSQDTWLEFFKANTDRNTKRGFTDFFSVELFLRLSTKVLRNTAEGAAIQAAIAYIRQHAPGITPGQIQNFQLGLATDQVVLPTPLGQQTVNSQRFTPGTILDTPQGQEYLAGPMGDARRAQTYVQVADAMARVAAVRWNMPEWMVNGDSSNNNRASSFVAESPFIKSVEVGQESEAAFWKRIYWKVIAFAHAAGRFGDIPLRTLRQTLNLEVKGAQINTREPDKETIRRGVLFDKGILSAKTWAQEEGYDLDQEVKNGAKKQAEATGQGSGIPSGMLTRSDGGESAARESAPADTALTAIEARLAKVESAADDWLAAQQQEYDANGNPLPKVLPQRYGKDWVYPGQEEAAGNDSPWIGVDLDSTLVHSPNGHFEPGKIGPPVMAMVRKVRKALAAGQDMKIMTARVASTVPETEREQNTAAIKAWCAKWLGAVLPITAEKDPLMVELWDDRARQVKPDEGTFVDGKESSRQLAVVAKEALAYP